MMLPMIIKIPVTFKKFFPFIILILPFFVSLCFGENGWMAYRELKEATRYPVVTEA